MINRPTTWQEPGYLEPTNDQHQTSLSPPKRASRIFGRRFSFSSDSLLFSASLSSSQTVRRPSTVLKDTPSASPLTSPGIPKPLASPTQGIVSVLNSMYAQPMNQGRVDSHPAHQSSLHLGGHTGGSISILTQARSSAESNTQKVLDRDNPPTTQRKPSFRPSMKTNPQAIRSESISSGSTGSSKSKNNTFKNSQDGGSTLRVVGRGGSGSKLRVVAPHSGSLNVETVRQEHPPPLIRPSGRGGFASRPKPLDAPPVPPKINPKPPMEPDQPSFIRPSGRGGLASRPKPIGSPSSPPLFKLLRTNLKNKNGIDKGKRKALEPIRAIHPLPPNLTYQISNRSTATLSTIHFIDETGDPSTPFFPDDDSSMNFEGSTHTISSALSGSSMYATDQSSSKSSILSDQTAETTEECCNENLPTNNINRRHRNLLKLARTLGYFPDDAVMTAPCPTDASAATSPSAKKNRNAKVFRRASISVTSLASIFGKPGAGMHSSGRESVATSNLTDGSLHHHFGLEDDLSDSWGRMSTSSVCERAASPIVFSPPSPAREQKPNSGLVARSVGPVIACQEKPATSHSRAESVSSSTLTSSEYNVFTPSQGTSPRASSQSHQYSTGSILPDLAVESNKSVWLVPVRDDDEFDLRPQRYRSNSTTTTLNVKTVSDKSGTWSGEWNEDIHEVIKSLRRL